MEKFEIDRFYSEFNKDTITPADFLREFFKGTNNTIWMTWTIQSVLQFAVAYYNAVEYVKKHKQSN